MAFEIARFLLISLPQMLFPLSAVFIIISLDLKKNFKQLLLISFFTALLGVLTFHFINNGIVANVLNIIVAFALFKLILNDRWVRISTIFLLHQIFVFSSTILGHILAGYLFNMDISDYNFNLSVLAKSFLPAFVIWIPVSFIIRPIKNYLFKLYLSHKYRNNYHLLVPTILQLLLVMLLFSEYVSKNFNFIKYSFLSTVLYYALFLLSIYILFKSVSIAEKRIIYQSQEIVTSNILNLVHTVRSQRHDFVNHLEIIKFLIQENKTESLNEYIAKISGDISFYNKLLTLNDPIISALVNVKAAQAEINKIEVKLKVDADLLNLSTRSFDISRILGNLFDNALDAISQESIATKWIELKIEESGAFILFSVNNPGTLPAVTREDLFRPGFSTKGDGHEGLGLYISEQIAKKMHGVINYSSTKETGTTFSLVIPKP